MARCRSSAATPVVHGLRSDQWDFYRQSAVAAERQPARRDAKHTKPRGAIYTIDPPRSAAPKRADARTVGAARSCRPIDYGIAFTQSSAGDRRHQRRRPDFELRQAGEQFIGKCYYGQNRLLARTNRHNHWVGFSTERAGRYLFHEFPEEYPDIFLSAVANQQGNFVTAEFAPQQIDLGRIFTLTAIGQSSGFSAQTAFHDNKNFVITFVGTGSGSVTFTGVTTSPSPSPNPCIGTCSVALDNNATGTITAAANVGSVFGGWSAIVTNGNGSITCTADSCTFNMGSGSGAAKAITVTFTAAAVTTTTVTSSANPSTYGQSVTFTASVKVGATAVTSGSVTFIEGGTCAAPTTTLAGPTALNGSGQAAFSTSTLTVPLHTIIACYGGAAGFNSSNGSVTQR